MELEDDYVTDAELNVLIGVSLKEIQRLCEQLEALVENYGKGTGYATLDAYASKIARLAYSIGIYQNLKTKGE